MTSWELDDLKNLPVVSKNDAKKLGRVEEVLFNPSANALFGLVVKPEEKDAPVMLPRIQTS
jgi:sporulation protein YlmC with PRC-barrel domain